jgi:hypothetical protein
MRRTHQALTTLALGLALVTATTAAWATPPTGTQDQADQRRPLNQPQQERTLARHRALGAIAEGELLADRTTLYQPQPDRYLQQRAQAGIEKERALARHRALLARHRALLARHRALGAIAAQPAARTDPAAPNPGVNVLATLLVGLVGGLVGGAAALLGWTATTRRRRPPAAVGS